MNRKQRDLLNSLTDALVLTGSKSGDRLPDEKQLQWIEDSLGPQAVERVLAQHGAAGEKLLKAWRAKRNPSVPMTGKRAAAQSKSGEIVMYKQQQTIERAARRKAVADDAAAGTGFNRRPGAGLYQLPSRDPKFLIADDGERLLKKSEALGVPSWAHDVLVMHIGKDVLEKVYDTALNTPTQGKSTNPVIERDLQRAALVEAGIPETVLNQLHLKLGDDDFARVMAALAQHVGTMKMWGKEAADRALLMQKPAPPPEEYVNDPFWGKLRKTRR